MSSSFPLLSVIIPCYNYGHFLPDTLRSIYEQNLSIPLEIIVVDDGSKDDTAEIIKPFLASNVKYIYQQNAGLSAARNTGIMASKGKFIQFLDADDMLGANALSARLKLLQNNPDISIAVCRSKIFRGANNGRPQVRLFEGWPIYKRHLDVHFCNFNIAPPHAFLLRREVIDKIGLFDTNLAACEDYDFWLRALFSGIRFMFCKHGIVYYRRHKESMSHDLMRQRKFDSLLHLKLYNYIVSNDYFKNRAEVLMAFISGVLCTCMRFSKLKADPPQELLELYNWAIDEIKKIKCFHNSCLTYLYFLQSLLTFKYSRQTFQNSDIFKNRLFAAIPAFDFSGNKLKLYQNIVNYAFFSPDAGFLERYRILKYTFLLDVL